jgi:PKD repeat protein
MKKISILMTLILLSCLFGAVSATSYTPIYPNGSIPSYTIQYVNSTTWYPAGGEGYRLYVTANPATALTGATAGWATFSITNQRLHWDLGTVNTNATIIRRIQYNNYHDTGSNTDRGIKTFTFWGSNSYGSFAELTYSNDTGWTPLTASASTFDIHASSNTADTKYITINNTVAYRYYAIKVADGWGGTVMGARHIELQTEDGYTPAIAPVASFTPTGSITGTDSVTQAFTDTSTNTPTGWSWTYQGIATGNNTQTIWSTAQNPTGTFGVGNFSIKLNATNAYGYNLSTQSTWINVSATIPVSSFTPTGVVTGTDLVTQTFTDTSTGSPTTWNWSYQGIAAGNNTLTIWSTSRNATGTFGPGNFSIKLNVTNANSYNLSTQSTWVNVSSSAISIQSSFTPNITLGYYYPLPVTFTDNSTGSPVSWSMDFGDTYTSTLQNPSHIYTVAGNYTVNQTVTNATGGTSSSTKYVQLVSDNDAYLRSWLQFENATVIDLKGVAWTNSGGVLSAPGKFLNQSLSLSGNNYISSASSTIWDRSSVAGEVEGWFNVSTYGDAGKPFFRRSSGTSGTSNGWGFFNINGTRYGNAFYYGSGANYTTPFDMPPNTWTHVALVRGTDQYWRVYVNGNLWGTPVNMAGLNVDTTNAFTIGSSGPGTEHAFRVDEFRYTQGVPRFVSNFSTPYSAYRGSLTGGIDPNPYSTLRYKTDPADYASAIIYNQSYGGMRNRTIQIQNVTTARYVIGSVTFDPVHESAIAIRPNTSTYTDLVFESSSIDNVGGTATFNVSRSGVNMTSLYDNRTSIVDVQLLYHTYSTDSIGDQFFAYGYIIDGGLYPVHNFIATNMTYGMWGMPTTNFTADTTSPAIYAAVQFNDTTGNYPDSWSWDFGDGSTSTLQNPTHAYTSLGLKTVTLTAYLAANTSITNTSTKTNYINVVASATPPIASFVGSPTTANIGTPVSFTDTSTNTPTSWTWTFGDSSGSGLQNPTHAYSSLGLYTVNLTATNVYGSNTTSRVAYINVTNVTISSFTPVDIVMSPSYILTLRVTDATTGIGIGNTTIVDYVTGLTSYTDAAGTVLLSEPYGVAAGSAAKDGYYPKGWSYIIDSNQNQTIQLSQISSSIANTNVIYQAQLYRFIFRNLVGTPLGGLSVRISPMNLTMNSTWTTNLMGISPNVDIQNGAIIGITGMDGSFGAPLITPMSYFVNISGTAQSGDVVNYFIPVYPPSSGTDILINLPTDKTQFPHLTPTPSIITYNIFNQSINSSAETLSVNYLDSTGATNLTIVTISNQSGHILNQTIYTGASATNIVNNFTYVQGVTSPPGDSISYGFSAYVSTAGGWNNISQPLVFNHGAPFTGSTTYNSWIAIILIVFVGAAFTASTVYIGTIGVGLMGLFFYAGTKWFTPGMGSTAFITLCCFWICIGIIGHMMKKTRSPF